MRERKYARFQQQQCSAGLHYMQLGVAADEIVAEPTLKAFNYRRLTAPADFIPIVTPITLDDNTFYHTRASAHSLRRAVQFGESINAALMARARCRVYRVCGVYSDTARFRW